MKSVTYFMKSMAMLGVLVCSDLSATVLTLGPSEQIVTLNDDISLSLQVSELGNTAEPSIGAYDINILFDDTIFQLDTVAFGDPKLGNQLDVLGFNNNLNNVTLFPNGVNLFELSFDSQSDLDLFQFPEFILATLTFSALESGFSEFSLNINAVSDTLGLPLNVSVSHARISVVPEPGSLWLMLASLLSIVVIKLQQKNVMYGRKCQNLCKSIFDKTTWPVFLGLLFFCITPVANSEEGSFYGVVKNGELGSNDAGMLVQIDPDNGVVNKIGNTGLKGQLGTGGQLEALTYDTVNKRLIAGTEYRIYAIDIKTAEATELVSFLDMDPNPPVEVNFVGSPSISSLFFLPNAEMLYGIVQDFSSDYLVKLDLDQVTSNRSLAMEIIGVVGSANYAYSDSPIGFKNVAMTLNTETGEILATGIDKNLDKVLFNLPIQGGNVPLASQGILLDSGLLSLPRAMAFQNNTPYITGFKYRGSQPTHWLLKINANTGNTIVVGNTALSDQVSGTVSGLAMVPELDDIPPKPPVIHGFSPQGGNCGMPVKIFGSGFTANGQSNIKSVEFIADESGRASAIIGQPTILSDTEMLVTVPAILETPSVIRPKARVRITTLTGDSTVSDSLSGWFYKQDIIFIEDQNQGLSASTGVYPLIAGKDTLFRLLTGTTNNGAAKFDNASLNITTPFGRQYVVQAEFYSNLVAQHSPGERLTEKDNINFYVDGGFLRASGNYTLEYEVKVDPRCPTSENPPKLISKASFRQTKDDLRLLFVYGMVKDGINWVIPDESSRKSIPNILEEFSRTYPVRKGVAKLGQPIAAGVRYDFSPMGVQLSENGFNSVLLQKGPTDGVCAFRHIGIGSFFCDVEDAVEPLRDRYNEENPDYAKYVIVLVGDEMLSPDSDRGIAGGGRDIGVSMTVLQNYPGNYLAKTPMHEVGHNTLAKLGDTGHEDSCSLGSRETHRAFNVSKRQAVSTPQNMMGQNSTPGCDFRDGTTFFSGVDYNDIYTDALEAASSIGVRTFSMTLGISETNDVQVIQSYASTSRKLHTSTVENSPYAIQFKDADGNLLREDPVGVEFEAYFDGEETITRPAVVLTISRPIPDDTMVVNFVKDEYQLLNIQKSEKAPSVDVVLPTGGESYGGDQLIHVKWTSVDVDNPKDLRFNVSYSPDGERWIPVMAAIKENDILFSSAMVPGSLTGRVKITATDGFNTFTVESAHFKVENKAPTAKVISPSENENFLQFDTVLFKALVNDLEEGVLSKEQIQWFNGQQLLGSGLELALEPEILSVGSHTIQLRVSDSDNHEVFDEVNFVTIADTDKDGISDEIENGLTRQDPNNPYDSIVDEDNDGLDIKTEIFLGTSPQAVDSDSDGIPDKEEIDGGTNPAISRGDLNSDGFVDLEDISLLTSVLGSQVDENDPKDFDGDGIISAMDARQLVLICSLPRCAIQ